MFYKKPGLPEENDIVICVVKGISYHSVVLTLEEYKNLEGMLHISEVAPGRIRNIRDYVREGKLVVCKVLRVNKEKRYIDLSLRRVPTSVRKNKIDEYRQEERAEKLLNSVAKKLKLSLEDMYKKVGYKLIDEYGLLATAFNEILINEQILTNWDIEKKLAAELIELIKKKIKPLIVHIESTFLLRSYGDNGIDVIKKSFEEGKKFSQEHNYDINLIYLGAPRYKLIVKAGDYKTAEKITEKVKDVIIEEVNKQGGVGEWLRKS